MDWQTKKTKVFYMRLGLLETIMGLANTMTRCFIAGKRAANKFRDQRSTLDRLLLAYCQTNSRCSSMF